MGDDKEKPDECKMAQTDSEGNTNLCCCYILDQDDQYEDPYNLNIAVKMRPSVFTSICGLLKI